MGRLLNFPCHGNNYSYGGEETVTESEGVSEQSSPIANSRNDTPRSRPREYAHSQTEDSTQEQADTENELSAGDTLSSGSEYRSETSTSANSEDYSTEHLSTDSGNNLDDDDEYTYIEEVILESGPSTSGDDYEVVSPFGDDCVRLLDSPPTQDFRFLRRTSTIENEKYLTLTEREGKRRSAIIEVILMHHLVDYGIHHYQPPTGVVLDKWLKPIDGDWDGGECKHNISDVVLLRKVEYEDGIKTLTRQQSTPRADLGQFLLDPETEGYSIWEENFDQKLINITKVFRSLLQNVTVMAPIIFGSLTACTVAEQEFRQQRHASTSSDILDPFPDSEGMQLITYRAIVEMIHSRQHNEHHSWRQMSSLFWPLANQVRYLKYVKNFLRRVLHPAYHEACVNIMICSMAKTVPEEIFRQIPLNLPPCILAQDLALDDILEDGPSVPMEDPEEKKFAMLLTTLWSRKHILWLEGMLGMGLSRG